MNSTMSSHTQRLALKLAFAIVLFVLAASSLAVLSRYRENRVVIVAQHRIISDKLVLMRRTIAEEREAITRFKKLLPAGYGDKSPEWFIYRRLDEIKSRLALQDLTINEIIIKDGVRTARFSFKLPQPDYGQVLNKLAILETELFPFVSIGSIVISRQPGDLTAGPAMTVEGDVIMPATPEQLSQVNRGTGQP